jgi:hypothetical protein
MKAIKTVFYGHTNTLPSRIKASAEGVTSKFYTPDDGHEAAALSFCEFHAWGKNLVHGQLEADTWVHCFDPSREAKLVDRTPLQNIVTGAIERGEAVAIAGIPALPVTDNQKIQTYLDWVNNFLTVEKFAEHKGFTRTEAEALIAEGRALHEAATLFTVVTVSANTDAFGYKSVLLLCADGRGYECLYQAYGVESVPQRGICLPESKLPTYCRRELPKTTPTQAKKIIAGIR